MTDHEPFKDVDTVTFYETRNSRLVNLYMTGGRLEQLARTSYRDHWRSSLGGFMFTKKRTKKGGRDYRK